MTSEKQENEELKEIRKSNMELMELAGKNFHYYLLKQWVIISLLLPIGILLVALIFYFVKLPLPEPIALSKLEEISPVVFDATLTLNGLIIGFVPLISFFFVREMREHERDLLQDWKDEEKKRVKKDKKSKKEEKRKSENEKLKLMNANYTLLLMVSHNLRSGVLRYARTYVAITILLQITLICAYINAVGYEITVLSLLADIIILYVIFGGLIPLISIALYQPALRFVRYFVGREVIRIEPED